MINLIPQSAKKKVAQEYWVRVITVWLLLGSIGFLMLSVFLLPTYVIINQKISEMEQEANLSSQKTSSFDVSAEALINGTNKAKLLLRNSSTTPFSTYMTKLETIASPAVKLSQFDFSRLGDGGTIKLSGMADTRQALSDFRDALEKDGSFVAINLPISSLIKNVDVLFSLDLTLATTTNPI